MFHVYTMSEESFRVLQHQGSCEAGQCNERPGKWSCDRCWPMRGLEKNRMENGQTDRHTDGRTDRHQDSMTDPAQRAESVKIWWEMGVKKIVWKIV